LTDRERATVLAALRCWRQGLAESATMGPALTDQADVDNTVVPLTVGEIDDLCQRLESATLENPLAFDAQKPLVIKRFLRSGEFDVGSIRTVHDLYEQAGGMPDRSCCWDHCGEYVFEGEDGHHYVGTVEFVINQANAKYVQEVLEEIACEQEFDGQSATSSAGESH
jgi:hypothetical protein